MWTCGNGRVTAVVQLLGIIITPTMGGAGAEVGNDSDVSKVGRAQQQQHRETAIIEPDEGKSEGKEEEEEEEEEYGLGGGGGGFGGCGAGSGNKW